MKMNELWTLPLVGFMVGIYFFLFFNFYTNWGNGLVFLGIVPLVFSCWFFNLKGVIIVHLILIGLTFLAPLLLFDSVKHLVRFDFLAVNLFLLVIYLTVSFFKKMTERVRFYKNKSKDSARLNMAFMANISSEIKQPLDSIINLLSETKTKKLSPDKHQEITTIIENKILTVKNVLLNVIDYSLMEVNQLVVKEEEVSLNKLFEELKQCFALIEKNKPEVRLNFLTGTSWGRDIILTDSERLKQILTNLIQNAYNNIDEGKIDVRYTLSPDDKVLFKIQDTGRGMDEDTLQTIFNRHRQVFMNQNTKERSGNCLGLATAKALVQLMQGEIWVTSDDLMGTEFTFSIPLKTNVKVKYNYLSNKINLNDLLHDKLILLVDSDDQSENLLKELLFPSRVRIARLNNGIEAIDFCDENKVDLILIDTHLPLMNGLDATKVIKINHSNIPIIMQSSKMEMHEMQESMKVGGNAILAKPLMKEDLYKAISAFIN